jgi:hypothetical protein
MHDDDSAAARKERLERQSSAGMMQLLTGGLTSEGDTFLIGAGAVILFVALYPLVSGWALLVFPVVLIVTVAIKLRRGQK